MSDEGASGGEALAAHAEGDKAGRPCGSQPGENGFHFGGANQTACPNNAFACFHRSPGELVPYGNLEPSFALTELVSKEVGLPCVPAELVLCIYRHFAAIEVAPPLALPQLAPANFRGDGGGLYTIITCPERA